MVVAAIVVQEYGWTGFLVMLAAMTVLAWLAKRFLPRLFGYLLTRPLRQMGVVMQGATIVVHSVTPAEPPPPTEFDNEEQPAFGDQQETDDDSGEWNMEEHDQPTPVGPLDWYFVEFTVTPRDAGMSEGRIVNRRGWSPAMISATATSPNSRLLNPFRGWPREDFVDLNTVQPGVVDIWDGANYVTPIEMIFGEQRLRMHVGVARRVQVVTLIYAQYTEIGEITIPRIDVRPESQS